MFPSMASLLSPIGLNNAQGLHMLPKSNYYQIRLGSVGLTYDTTDPYLGLGSIPAVHHTSIRSHILAY